MIDLALAYAANGWPVFPLEPQGKQPIGRLVPNGLKNATTDETTIRHWWDQQPDANIGIPTGVAFDAGDLDNDEAMKGFISVCAEHGSDPRGLPRTKTGRGRHVLFAPTGLGNKVNVLLGMDWRGKGGYIVAPGSIHPNGEKYEWIQEPAINGKGPRFPEAPEWLLARLRPAESLIEIGSAVPVEPPPNSYVEKAVREEMELLRSTPEGQRNDQLNRSSFAMGQIVGAGWLDRGRAEAELKAAAHAIDHGREPGMSATIRSGLESGMREPRQAPPGGWSFSEKGGEIRHGSQIIEILKETAEEEILTQEPTLPEGPAPDAYHGLLSRLSDLISGFVESDQASVFVQLLATFGAAAGIKPYMMVGATRHAPAIYVGMVGRTSRGRKGTSWDPIEVLFRGAASDFGDRIFSGVGSGERLVWLVRDDVEVFERRLLLREPELARLLTVINREGSTMSAYLREAYDGKPLRNEVKNNPSCATTHHIGLIGHCTQQELRGQLSEQQIRNGLANRIAWFLARRDKRLANPPIFEGEDVDDAIRELRAKIQEATAIRRVSRSDAAQRVWEDWYSALPDEETGPIGAITDRAETQVNRFSLIFALTDGSSVIEAEHLFAAIAVWDYSRRCVEYIWGGTTGDIMADRVVRELQHGPMLQGDVHRDVFYGRASGETIERVARLLESQQKLVRVSVKNGRPGRPAVLWRLPQR